MATSQATENNQKLFRRYAKMFYLNDPHTYTSHAEKLSLWLNDFKAYYTAARPEIVKLLLIAQMTLRRALGLAEDLNAPFNASEYSEYPMAKSYIKLVKTVEPFECYFTEPGLLAHIKSLLASISPPHAPCGTQQPITHFQSDIQTHPYISEPLSLPSYVSETRIAEPSSSTMASAPNILPAAAKAPVKPKKRKAVDFDFLVRQDIKALLEKQGNKGDSSQHVTEDPPPSKKSKASPLIECQDVSAQAAYEDIKALLVKQGNQGVSSQHVTEDSMVSFNSLGDPLPSDKASPVVEFQDIAQAACEHQKMAVPDQITESLPSYDTSAVAEAQGTSWPVSEDRKMATPDQLTESLPSQDTSAATEAQGTSWPVSEDRIMTAPVQIIEPLPSQDTSAAAKAQETSSPTCEDQKMESLLSHNMSAATEAQGTSSPTYEDQTMAAPDQITQPLPSQDTSAAVNAQGPSSPTSEDQKIATSDQIAEPLLSQDTSGAAEAQGTSWQAVAKDRETAPLDSGRGPSALQKAIEPQNYSLQTVTQNQEMETDGTTEAPLPSKDAGVTTEPQSSSWQPEAQERQKIALGDSGDAGSLPSQKTSTAIETQGLATMLINKKSVTASLQPSPHNKTRNLTPLVSSDHLGSISSVQGVRPLIPPASADSLVKGSPCSTMPEKFGQDMRIITMQKGLSKECTMTFTFVLSSTLFPKVSAWLNRNVFSLNIEQSLCLSLGCYSITDLQEQSTKNKCTTLEQQTSVARSYWPQRGGLSMNVQFKNGREDFSLSPPFQVTPDGFVDVSQFIFAGENVIELNQTIDMSQYIFVLHSHYPTRAQLQEVNGRRQRDREWREWVCHVSRPFDISLKLIQT